MPTARKKPRPTRRSGMDLTPGECARLMGCGLNTVYKAIRLGLATLDCPPGDRPTVYLLTAAGEAAAVAERERRTPRKRRGPMRGRSKVDAAA